MDEYLEMTIKSLREYYGKEYGDNLNAPVKDIVFDTLNNSRVVFKKEIYEMINNIAFTTQIDSKEVGFLLYGKEFLPNQVYFNRLVMSEAPLKSIEVEFDSHVALDLKEKIDENMDERLVACYGHSHPKISEDYMHFSLKDFANLVELTENVEDFKIKNMQLMGCLVTPDHPIQFMYFNPDGDKFLTFDSFEIEEEKI